MPLSPSPTHRRRAMPRALLLLACALGAAGPASPDSFPRLLPLDEILPGATAPAPRLSPGGAQPLLDRAARLRARAEALRTRQPIDPATRARIAALTAPAPD
ncbi:MAG: hypothetical protein ACXIUV_03075 [Alkalilacustris sp.]